MLQSYARVQPSPFYLALRISSFFDSSAAALVGSGKKDPHKGGCVRGFRKFRCFEQSHIQNKVILEEIALCSG
jgi:hypothetical protein